MMGLSDRAVERLQRVANWPDFSGTRYTLIDQVGRGGMGTVYVASDAELDREIAVKVTNAPAAHSMLDQRLRTEAKALATLEHPGIVPIYDAGTLPDGRGYYTMKLVRGHTLAEYMRVGAEEADLLRIFERICETVASAHAHDVIHRDLKPTNIMVGKFGEVFVMDWGVAKLLGGPVEAPASAPNSVPAGHTDPGTVLGTPGYMPPEQVVGDVARIDQRSDVYALGAILFKLLSGADPLSPAEGTIAHILKRRHAVPKRLAAICAKAMAALPEERYQGAAELAADMVRFRNGQAVLAYRETIADILLRLANTHKTAILLVLAYLLMRTVVALLSR